MKFEAMKCSLAYVVAAASLVCWMPRGSAQTLINGAGASFPAPIYQKWFSDYHKLHSDVEINYQPKGSGAGIAAITDGTVDFGASDGPLNDAQLKTFHDKYGYDLLHFPTVAGAAVPAYNIPGVASGLNFTGEALADIYLGKITKWNDPALTKANPKIKLPDADIVVVHRSDGSGTTYCWTDFLAKVNPEWLAKVGPPKTSVNWPVGLGAPQNNGVAGQVKQTPNSIGYIELIYALNNQIAYGSVKNPAGVFVKPDLASVTAAAQGAAKTMPPDFRVSITNAPGKAAYPISTFTWLLIPEQIKDPAKAKIMKDFLAWMLTTGQKDAQSLSYAELPKEVVAMEKKAISKIK
jgi:phosphate transport system substrate-binding protein